MKTRAIFFITLGAFLELINVFSIVRNPVDHSRGIDYAIGAYLFNALLMVVGIVLIVAGVKIEKQMRK